MGRFIQADTIIPRAGNPQAWDKYTYSSGNPVKYIDPTGHCTGDPNDPNNPDKACWDVYDIIINGAFEGIIILDFAFNLQELLKIYDALQLIANVFGNNTDALRQAFGTVSLMRVNQLPNGATGMTPPYFGGGLVFLSSNFSMENVIHELGHQFDFNGSNGNPGLYKSQWFVNWFGSPGCDTGSLGCLGDNQNIYDCKLNRGGGCGGYNPPRNSSQQPGTTLYGRTSSVDDFADSFMIYVLEQNGMTLSDNVSDLRKAIVALWVNKTSP